MSGERIEKKVTVGNRMGLHARPASCIATILADYPEAEVTLGRPDDLENAADCHSVLSLMILAYHLRGAEVRRYIFREVLMFRVAKGNSNPMQYVRVRRRLQADSCKALRTQDHFSERPP